MKEKEKKNKNRFIELMGKIFGNQESEEVELQGELKDNKTVDWLERKYGGYDDVIKASNKLQRTDEERRLLEDADKFDKATRKDTRKRVRDKEELER